MRLVTFKEMLKEPPGVIFCTPENIQTLYIKSNSLDYDFYLISPLDHNYVDQGIYWDTLDKAKFDKSISIETSTVEWRWGRFDDSDTFLILEQKDFDNLIAALFNTKYSLEEWV